MNVNRTLHRQELIQSAKKAFADEKRAKTSTGSSPFSLGLLGVASLGAAPLRPRASARLRWQSHELRSARISLMEQQQETTALGLGAILPGAVPRSLLLVSVHSRRLSPFDSPSFLSRGPNQATRAYPLSVRAAAGPISDPEDPKCVLVAFLRPPRSPLLTFNCPARSPRFDFEAWLNWATGEKAAH